MSPLRCGKVSAGFQSATAARAVLSQLDAVCDVSRTRRRPQPIADESSHVCEVINALRRINSLYLGRHRFVGSLSCALEFALVDKFFPDGARVLVGRCNGDDA